LTAPAARLGLAVPQLLLAQADEVIKETAGK